MDDVIDLVAIFMVIIWALGIPVFVGMAIAWGWGPFAVIVSPLWPLWSLGYFGYWIVT